MGNPESDAAALKCVLEYGLSFFNIYKKGQGKWVRLGTVIGMGLLIALGIKWINDTFMALAPAYSKMIMVVIFGCLGGLLCFYVVNRPNIADFMILTESEMRKVVWPSRQNVIRATRLVVAATLGLALMLWIVDTFFVWLFHTIHVIR